MAALYASVNSPDAMTHTNGEMLVVQARTGLPLEVVFA